MQTYQTTQSQPSNAIPSEENPEVALHLVNEPSFYTALEKPLDDIPSLSLEAMLIEEANSERTVSQAQSKHIPDPSEQRVIYRSVKYLLPQDCLVC